jgi:hypothetical protein
MQKRNSKQFSNLELVAGIIGVSPIPIAGEICGAFFFNKILKNTPFYKEGAKGVLLSAAVTGLTRLSLYASIYAPLYKGLAGYLKN